MKSKTVTVRVCFEGVDADDLEENTIRALEKWAGNGPGRRYTPPKGNPLKADLTYDESDENVWEYLKWVCYENWIKFHNESVLCSGMFLTKKEFWEKWTAA